MGGRSGTDWEAIRIRFDLPLSVRRSPDTRHGAPDAQEGPRGWKRDLSNVIRVETEATLLELPRPVRPGAQTQGGRGGRRRRSSGRPARRRP